MDIKELRRKTFTEMSVQRWEHPNKWTHAWGFVQGLAEIADGLVTVLSLGFFMSNFEMKIAYYRGLGHHLRQKKLTNLEQ